MTRKELIQALRAAKGPSRELDAAILEYLCQDTEWPTSDPRLFTSSIDAALTLVPEGRIWSIGKILKADGFVAVLDKTRQSHDGATPAIALCIAALEAMGDES